jgi:heme/copper-type cytochrome/quinol oxidase subunit 2
MVRPSTPGRSRTGARLRPGYGAQAFVLAGAALLTVGGLAALSGARQEPAQAQRAFNVVARKYAFAPIRLEVAQDDLVKVTMTSADIAHSFTIDAYRIDKRAGPKQTVTFEFRAHQPGTFRIYCKLTQDARCKEMHGELVVHKR